MRGPCKEKRFHRANEQAVEGKSRAALPEKARSARPRGMLGHIVGRRSALASAEHGGDEVLAVAPAGVQDARQMHGGERHEQPREARVQRLQVRVAPQAAVV